MQKPKTKSQLKKLADKYWSEYIRLRDSDSNGIAECITCGKKMPWKQAQCGHFVSRKVSKLRFDERNTNAQCPGCNVFGYGQQYAYGKALDLKYGDGTAEELHAQRFTSQKYSTADYQAIIDYAKEGISERS